MPPDGHHDASMLELLEKLNQGAKQRKPREILQCAEQVLTEFPGDEDALRFKLVALVQIDEFEKALSVIDSSGSLSNLDLKAYCLFRLGRSDEALDALRGLERGSFRLQLEAQIYYKKQDLDACTSCYQELLAAGNADEEVQANAIAAFLSAKKSDELVQLMAAHGFGKAKESYDLAYNAACALIAKGELSQAEEHLLLSRKIVQEKLMNDESGDGDGYTAEDVEDELAAVSVQMAYVQQVQGRLSEAADGYLSVLARNLLDKDLPSVVVSTNNLTAIRRNKEASDSLKKLELFLERDGKHVRFLPSLLKQLSVSQRETIMFNYFLLLLTLNKMNQARELIPTITEDFPDSTISYLLKACLYLKEGKLPKAEEVLGEYVGKAAAASTDALLLCAQARASTGHYLAAAESLERVEEAKHMPAMVATIVDLKQRGGDLEGAESVLDAAVDWWSKSMEGGTHQQRFLEVLSQKSAELKLLKKKFEDAVKLYDQLASRSSGSTRLEAFTGLVCCYAETDLAKAEFYERQLPLVDDVAALDVDALERAPGLLPAATATVEDKTLQEKTDEKAKKRKRKPRYPKGYDPENPGPPPDPERWLPMRERSYYRPRKKDKRAAARGSQGAVAKEATAAAPVSNGTTKPSSNDVSSSRQRNRRKGRR